MAENTLDHVWSEEMRPRSVSETILPVATKQMLQNYVDTGKVPNLLLAGGPGTGKTTAARAIANELGADLMFINGSLENGIDVLRTKIMQFASTVSFTDSRKIVLIDEADYLNANSIQPALRSFMDSFSDNCIFMLTCNYPNRIIEPLRSRLSIIDFKVPSGEKKELGMQMLKRCCSILKDKGIEHDPKAVAVIVTKLFPDFRKTLSELQRFANTFGKIDVETVSTAGSDDSVFKDLTKALREKDFGAMRKWVAVNTMEHQAFYRGFYDKVVPNMMNKSVPQAILLIADFQFKATSSVDLEINYSAFLTSVMQSCAFEA